jgi:hypothetical protein
MSTITIPVSTRWQSEDSYNPFLYSPCSHDNSGYPCKGVTGVLHLRSGEVSVALQGRIVEA